MASSLDLITGNEQRSQLILRNVWAARRAEGDVTFDAIASATSHEGGETFDPLSVEEYDAAVAMVELSAAQEPKAPAMARDAANARLKELQENLFARRKARMVAEAEQRKAREQMAQAITAWSAGGPTTDQITRNEIAAISRDRGAKAAHGSRPGPSYWDRFANATGHTGDANDFARGRHTHGGNRRGAYPSSARGRKVAVPSEQ
jgi:hypothetical protein